MKKLAIIAIVPLMFLALNGCGDTQQEEQVTPQDTMVEDTAPEVMQPEETDTEAGIDEPAEAGSDDSLVELQAFDQITENEDLKLEECEFFADQRMRDTCEAKVYLNQAAAELDESLCDPIAIEREKEDCKNYVQSKIVEQEFIDSQELPS
ncbi:hypothetical protein ACFL3C_04840 [Patescibacteria group bacterium]